MKPKEQKKTEEQEAEVKRKKKKKIQIIYNVDVNKEVWLTRELIPLYVKFGCDDTIKKWMNGFVSHGQLCKLPYRRTSKGILFERVKIDAFLKKAFPETA